MTHDRLSQLLRRWVYRVRRPGQRGPVYSTRNLVRLAVDECEARVAPATLPAPTVAESRVITDEDINTGPLFFTPNTFESGQAKRDTQRLGTQAAIHPADPNRMVVVSSRVDGIVLQFTTDGGANWQTLFSRSNTLPLNGSPNKNQFFDPQTDQQYTNASSPSVAVGRDGHIYLVYLEHNANRLTGEVVFNSWSWTGTTPSASAGPTSVYHWSGFDRAENPVVGVPTGPASYTDPETGTTITNSMVAADGSPKGVYVAWNTVADSPTADELNPSTYFQPNAILTASTQDRGATFSSPVFVNRLGYWGDKSTALTERSRNSFAPRIAFGPTGVLTFAWESFNPNNNTDFLPTPELGAKPTPADNEVPQVELVFDSSFPGSGKPFAVVNRRADFGQTGTVDNAEFTFDAAGNKQPNDKAITTKFELDLPASFFTTNFDKLTDLDVGIALSHPRLDQVRIVLRAPDDTTITLLRNRTNNAGTAVTAKDPFLAGVDGNTGMGVIHTPTSPGSIKSTLGYTVFDDNAVRLINDPNGNQKVNSYIGFYRPDDGSLSLLNGRDVNGLKGKWYLEITDNRKTGDDFDFSDGKVDFSQTLHDWYLNFTSYQTNDGFGFETKDGLNSNVETTVAVPTAKGDQYNLKSASDPTNTFTIPASPTVPVGPSISIAYDHSFGPLARTGTLYAAYTAKDRDGGNDTDIRLISSTNNGAKFSFTNRREKPQVPGNIGNSIVPYEIGIVNDDSPFDHRTEGNRSQFFPSVAVDPVTGYVTVMWYDARNDAANARADVFLATSMDGGATFGPQVPVTPPKLARDTITGEQVTLETTPVNIGAAANGVGVFPGSVLAFGGKITPFWTGNFNDDKTFVFTANVRLPAGPQIVGSDMGPVTDPLSVTNKNTGAAFTFNTAQADGTRQLDGFRVTFDRPVDPRTFQPDDVQVKFRGPNDNDFSKLVAVAEVFPIDGGTTKVLGGQTVVVNATQYFVRFQTPQTAVGTYSYTVGPDVRDFSRAIDGFRRIRPDASFAQPFEAVGPAVLVPAHPPVFDPTTKTTAAPVVADVVVEVTSDTPGLGNYSLSLRAPDGTVVPLTNSAVNGDLYVRSRFDGASLNDVRNAEEPYATQALYDPQAAPFTGTFRPVGDLSRFAGVSLSTPGTWTLEGVPAAGQPRLRWKLGILPGFKNSAVANVSKGEFGPAIGAPMDQDGDSRSQESAALFPTSNDQYSVPRPTTGTPFTMPYVSTTRPLILAGPRVRPDTTAEDNVTVSGQGAGTTTHNKLANQVLPSVVVNPDARTIDVTFDRPMDTTSFTPADLVRLTGPFGDIPLAGITVTAVGGTQDKTFRITVPDALAATFVSGQYSLEIGSDIKSAAGDKLDTNMNAGLFRLIGGDPATPPRTLADTATYAATDPGNKDLTGTHYPIPQDGVLSVPIAITDDYIIRQTTGRNPTDPHILVRMSIQHDRPADLQAELVSPDGFRVPLFTGIGNAKSSLLKGFTGVFDDNAVSPIQTLNNEFPTEPVLPQFPLSDLAGRGSKGEWRLEIRDTDSDGVNNGGKLLSWGLTFPFSNPVENGMFQGTTPPPRPGVPPVAAVNVSALPNGLGEPIADRFTIGFRVFNQDALDPRSRQFWVPVGPTSMNGQTNETNNAGRVSAVAVDPSDPSGNTVYVGAGSGGVWKTTNFLTTGDAGPVWVPLTDFGPNNGLAVSSILLVPQNNDPNQTVVYALTGDGSRVDGAGAPVVSPLPGVGVLRSRDAGKTWQVLDSSKNVDGAGNLLPIDAPTGNAAGQRNRVFFGAQGMKIIADPRPSTPEGKILLYMAVGGDDPNSQGVWRSRDGGDTWVRIRAGKATDVLLAPSSAGSTGNLERLYAAFEGLGGGVFTTTQAPSATAMTPINGGTQTNPLLRDVGSPPGTPGADVTIAGSTVLPTANGRISLALPALTDNPLENTLYGGWLYALLARGDGGFNGLFVTKDFGLTWTPVRIPNFSPGALGDFKANQVAFGSNDETEPDYDIFTPQPLPNAFPNTGGLPRPPQGNYAQSISVDPQNPNIVYLGGLGSSNGRPLPVGGSIRVDTTRINDPYTFVFWDNTGPNGGATRPGTDGTAGAQDRADETNRPISPLPPPPASPGGPAYPPARTEGALFRPDRNPNIFDFYFGGIRSNYENFSAAFDTYPNNFEDFLNLYRDPDNPFLTPTTLRVFNTSAVNNNGHNVAWRPFTEILGFRGFDSFDKLAGADTKVSGANDVHEIVPFNDPLTGRTRFIYATDHGVFTGVADENGELIRSVGFAESVTYSRNGNLQIAQFNKGAVQPSQLAADIAGALFYGMSRDNGFPVSSRDVLRTGDTNWNNPLENAKGSNDTNRYDPTGTEVLVDPTGSGTAFEYRWPGTSGPGIQLPTDFFRVFGPNTDHSGEGTSRTKGLLSTVPPVDNPGQNAGQWPLGDERPVGHFAVNPYDAKGLVIGSLTGQVFRTTDQGVNWFSVGTPEGSTARAFAFGAPVSPAAELNNFVYAGTQSGNVYISYDNTIDTFTGGFTPGTFSDISAGINDNTPVMQIIPNPAVGSREAFLVTQQKVYYAKDVVAIAEGAGQWADITGKLFTLARPVFGEAGKVVVTNGLRSISSLAVDWRVEFPENPADPAGETFPPLYVAGDGGVFQSLNKGKDWAFYPDATVDGAPVTGGYLPNVKVTDLDLAIGPFDPTTGKFKSENSLNLLVATTYGRGTFTIRLPLNRQSGPAIVSVQNPTPTGPATDKLGVTFNQLVDDRTFDETDVRLFFVSGATETPVNVIDVQPDLSAKVPGQPDLTNTRYFITFDSQSNKGYYRLVIGPDIRDISGELMNQDRDKTNGEPLDDQFNRFVFLNGEANSLVVTGVPRVSVAGDKQPVSITATDSMGNVIPGYVGTVQLTVSLPANPAEPRTLAVGYPPPSGTETKFPITLTFDAADAGVEFLPVEFRVAGLQILEATRLTGPAINPGKIETTVIADDPTRIEVANFPSPVTAGESKTFTVTAKDQFDNVADKYRGTVAFSSTDTHPSAVLPGPYTFTATDAGMKTFSATLVTATNPPNRFGVAPHKITATDAANGFADDQAGIQVKNAATDKVFLSGLPGTVTAGQQGVTFTATAKDRFGNVAIDYDDVVTFTTSDPRAIANPGGSPEVLFNGTTFNFNPDPATGGVATIPIEFRTAGTQTVTVTAPTPVAGDTISTVVVADVATKLALTNFTPNPVIAGDAGTFKVAAQDKFGNTDTKYGGTITFTSSDPNPTLPPDSKLVNGEGTFAAVLKTVGIQSITAKDTVTPSIAGTLNGIDVRPSDAGSFVLSDLPVEVTAGEPTSYKITVRRANGQTSFGYLGTVVISSTDGQAVFQTMYTFQASDYGVKTLPIEFRTAGGQSITVRESAGPATPGTISTTVRPSVASGFAVGGFPDPVTAGDTKSFQVKAVDRFGNTATGYAGTVNFSSSDPQATLPQNGKLTNGVGAFAAILKTAGEQSITAKDSFDQNITGTQVGITVEPATANAIFVTALPSPLQAGEKFGFTVTLKDVFGNVATGFTGDVQFASTDPQAVLPPTYTFTAADQGVKAFTGAEFRTAGPRNLSVTSNAGGVNPGSASTVVIAGPATQLFVTPLPASLTAGEAASFRVTAKDKFGNVAEAFAGTLNFTSTDPQATLPAPYTFNPPADKGVQTFGVTLVTAGDQSVTITSADGSVAPVTLTTSVRPAITTRFEVTGGPAAITAGGTVTVNITARDQFGNVDTGYSGTIRFASSDKQATLPPDSSLRGGVGTFTVTLRSAGPQSVTATATSDPALTGTVPVAVAPGAATRFDLTGPTGTVIAGSPLPVDVTARDAFGNLAAGYNGTVRFTSTDPNATLPPNGALTNGVGRFTVVLRSAGSQVVTAADTANPAVSGSLTGVTVVLPPPPPNTPPTITDITDQTVRLNQRVGPLAFTIGDALSQIEDLRVTFTTSDPGLFPPAGITIDGVGADRKIALVPGVGQFGTATITVTVEDPGGLTATDAFTVTVQPTTGPEPPVLIGSEQFAVGTDKGGSPVVRFFNADGTERVAFDAFADSSFSGGVRTATADFNRDGIADIVVGTGPGVATFVRVIDGRTLAELFSITPFEVEFTGGVYVAAGDLTGDGVAELVITPDEGGGPRVRVFDGAAGFAQIIDFFGIDDTNFRGGARAAVGDVSGDRVGDLIVAAGFQGGPRVAGYNGKSLTSGIPLRVFGDFFAFEQTLRNGVYVAAGDLDGDGFAEVIAGGGPGGGPRVTAFSGKALRTNVQQVVANFFGGDPDNRGGVRIAVKDLDDDTRADLLIGDGTGAGARVTGYLGKNISPAGTPPETLDFDAFTRFNGGVFVG